MNETRAVAPVNRVWAKRLIVIGLVFFGLMGWWWWANRSIEPVVLSAAELKVVQGKVAAIQHQPMPKVAQESVYERGRKEIVITERELNGLLYENTNAADQLSFELEKDEIRARLETDLDQDLPWIGGTRLKARALFVVKSGKGETEIRLDDVSVWGISLPNEWLGGILGKDLLTTVFGCRKGHLSGIEELRVEHGQILIRLAD